jgi:hypothetical protein
MTDSSPVPSPDNRQVHELLAEQFDRAITSIQLAEMMAVTLSGFAYSLRGVIGLGGFEALLNRTVFLCMPSASWLHALHAEEGGRVDLGLLQRLFAAQARRDAVCAAIAFIRTFSNVLADIIGFSLAERLLQPVLTDSPFTDVSSKEPDDE